MFERIKITFNMANKTALTLSLTVQNIDLIVFCLAKTNSLPIDYTNIFSGCFDHYSKT